MNCEYCENCKYADHDYYEYYGGARQWFICGCKKDLEPYYDENEEATTCDGYKMIKED